MSDVPVRVRLPGAAEFRQRKAGELEGGGIEVRVLAGQHDPRDDPAAGERSCDGRKLDGFRTRTDDERNSVVVQLPSWLGAALVAALKPGCKAQRKLSA
jgi:hypothetical protein